MWICWVAVLAVAHSLWSLSWLAKCLSGAINLEYRIRPDWQAIMLPLAASFTHREAVYDLLPALTTCMYTYKPHNMVLLWKKSCWNLNDGICHKGKQNRPQKGRFVQPSPPSIHSDSVIEVTSWAPFKFDGLPDPPGGVWPLGLVRVAGQYWKSGSN